VPTINAPAAQQHPVPPPSAAGGSQAQLLQQQRTAQTASPASPPAAQTRPPAPVTLPSTNAPVQQRQAGQGTATPVSQSQLLQQQRSAQTIPIASTLPVNGTSAPAAAPPPPVDKPPAKGGGKDKKVEWGPVQKEAVAICRQQKKGTWQCFGPLDNDVLGGDATLEVALARQHCAGGTWAAGGPTLHDEQFEAYRCGHALGAGDYDLVKRYNLITAQRSYICPKYALGDGRCTTPYDGQDKR
jgi:hypothetical protein